MRKVLFATWLLLSVLAAFGRDALAVSSGSGANVKTDVTVTSHVPLFGKLCPLEERLFADATDRQLDEFSLLQSALIAGGVRRAETLQLYEEQFAALVDQLRESCTPACPPRERAKKIFEFMHRRVLSGGYRIDCTDLRATLDEGRFNCLSASVLFNCLAAEFDLPVCGLEIPGHAMSRLLLDAGPLDLETTCPGWFQLTDDPAKQAEAVARTVGHISPKDRSKAREVSPVEIAAMIYYNRGVDLLAEKQFAEAAAANAKALRLDPASTTARGNLLAVLNNWAIELGAADRHAEAVELLREGLAFDPKYEPFVLNYVHVHHKWVEQLRRVGKLDKALDVLAHAAEELPEEEYFQLAPLQLRSRKVVGGRR